MPLHPQVKAFLDATAAEGLPPYHTMSPSEARQAMRERSAPFLANPPAVARVEELSIPGPDGDMPVRIYTPHGMAPFPALVYFHGGGWVQGDLDTHDSLCRGLAIEASCVVVSVGYRLAPENPFPAPVDDAYAATRWVFENAPSIEVDAVHLSVGGDSAGGALAAAVCLMARDSGNPSLSSQLQLYPVTNHSFDTGSYEQYAAGYQLTREGMEWFWHHYLSDEADGLHPHASPLRAADFSSLPPAVVVTAEYDPLRDEGEAYARSLREAGVQVYLLRYDGMIHNFVRMFPILDVGREALVESCRLLRAIWSGEPTIHRRDDSGYTSDQSRTTQQNG